MLGAARDRTHGAGRDREGGKSWAGTGCQASFVQC